MTIFSLLYRTAHRDHAREYPGAVWGGVPWGGVLGVVYWVGILVPLDLSLAGLRNINNKARPPC